MTKAEKNLAMSKRLASPPLCDCGVPAEVDPIGSESEFKCSVKNKVSGSFNPIAKRYLSSNDNCFEKLVCAVRLSEVFF